VLVDPLALPPGAPVLHTASGAEPAWLRTAIAGRLRWRARLPLGAAASVERYVLEDAVPLDETDGGGNRTWPYRVLDAARETLGKPWKEGAPLLGGYSGPRLGRLDPAEIATYAWPDDAPAALLRECGAAPLWGLVWEHGGAQQPLALLSPPGLLKRAALIHLVPGCPKSPLG
jgi:hypothetical protein